MKRVRGRTPEKRTKRSGDESGQALVIVLGIVLMLMLGTTVMAQNVLQNYPILQEDLVTHEAYRAMQAGLDEYLYEANANPNYVMCNQAQVETGGPTTWTASGYATLGNGLCTGLSLTSWTQVHDLASTNDLPAWFTYGTPTIYDCTSSTGCPSNNTWEKVVVVGAAGNGTQMRFQQATITIQPTNDFLLSLWWLNYDQQDPATISGDPSCGYYWQVGLETHCVSVDFVTGETITGNLFVNDSVFYCGKPALDGIITTVGSLVKDGSSCSSPPSGDTVKTAAHVESAPTDDAVLGSVAAQDGCLYDGPTEIKLVSTGGMDVYSPETPTSSGKDSLNSSSNTSTCIPGTPGGWVAAPVNGVVFVQDCGTCTTYAPLGTSLATSLYAPDTSGESVGPTEGDAIVEGTDEGPLTIAAENNVVIDGDICYASWTSNCTVPPTAPGNDDVLALIAYNFVELNHPVTSDGHGGYDNVNACPGTSPNELATNGPTGNLDCDLANPIIDAAILALNQQFDVHNFDQGGSQTADNISLNNITIEGAISEDWRGPVGQGSNGYSKQYTYDSRLTYLSPPSYLNPGTSSWALGAIAVTPGGCPSTLTACASANLP
jgi:hypothetical protein